MLSLCSISFVINITVIVIDIMAYLFPVQLFVILLNYVTSYYRTTPVFIELSWYKYFKREHVSFLKVIVCCHNGHINRACILKLPNETPFFWFLFPLRLGILTIGVLV